LTGIQILNWIYFAFLSACTQSFAITFATIMFCRWFAIHPKISVSNLTNYSTL